MTEERTPITSNEQLHVQLQELLREAYDNGIEVEGGFECRNGTDHPDWDVIVTEVEKDELLE